MQITDPIADMLTRIRNALTAKHEDVLVPASTVKKAIAEILLDEVMHRLNIKNYICSRTDGNAHIVDLCFRAKKVDRFKEMYPDTIIDNFYTDSVNDTPMMEISEHAFLVSGNKIKQVK